MAYFNIKGVIPPMITPFNKNDEVDYDKFVDNIEKWNEFDLSVDSLKGKNYFNFYFFCAPSMGVN